MHAVPGTPKPACTPQAIYPEAFQLSPALSAHLEPPGLLLLPDLGNMGVGEALPWKLGESLAHSPLRGNQGPATETYDRKRPLPSGA